MVFLIGLALGISTGTFVMVCWLAYKVGGHEVLIDKLATHTTKGKNHG